MSGLWAYGVNVKAQVGGEGNVLLGHRVNKLSACRKLQLLLLQGIKDVVSLMISMGVCLQGNCPGANDHKAE